MSIDALEKRWVWGWQKRGWIKSDKKPALNRDLWERLLPLVEKHEMVYHWIKGHAETEENNRCDELAVAESRKYKRRGGYSHRTRRGGHWPSAAHRFQPGYAARTAPRAPLEGSWHGAKRHD